jgi:hypothetical protein
MPFWKFNVLLDWGSDVIAQVIFKVHMKMKITKENKSKKNTFMQGQDKVRYVMTNFP